MNVLVLRSFLVVLFFNIADCRKKCNAISLSDEHPLDETIEFPKNFITRNVISNRRKQRGMDQVNMWGDILLAHANRAVVSYGLDSLRLPDIHKIIKMGLLEGKLDLVNGVVTKWATLNRAKNIQFKHDKNKNHYAVLLPLKLDLVKIKYNFKANIMNVGPKGTVETLIRNIGIRLNARFSKSTYQLHIDSFKIHEIGNIKVSVVEGGQSLTWFVNLLTKHIQQTAKELISSKISNACEDILRTLTKQVNDLIKYFKNFKLDF